MNKPTTYLTETYHGIHVSWLPELDGGGRSFGQDYVPVVRELYGRVGRVFEFCAGPAFIGFSLLAEGLCDSLCLSDVNPQAVAALNDTVARNHLQDRVRVYLSDSLSGIPPEELWDLVVSNPPHFEVETEEEYLSHIRLNDQRWRIHKEFYAAVKRHLKQGGSILMQENHLGSEESTFDDMVAACGLEVVDSFMFQNGQQGIIDPYFYYWVAHKGSGQKMDRTAHPRFVFNDPEILSLSTSDDTLKRADLSSGRRYRVQVANLTGSAHAVAIFKRRYGFLWRQPISPIMNVAAGETRSVPVRFGPGTYQVRVSSQVLGAFDVS